MSRHIEARELIATRELVAAPPVELPPRACTDRDFNIPTALHAGFFGLFLAYLGVMWIGFGNPNLAIPMAIFVLFTVAFYVVPMLWSTMQGPNETSAMPLARLWSEGVATHTGLTSGGAAAAQVLVLPVLILVWGVAVVTIAALV